MPYGTFHDISARIRQIRGKLKKAKFADLLGISRPNFYKYESGRRPPADVLQKIADYGGVTVKWLLTGQDDLKEKKDPGRAGQPEHLLKDTAHPQPCEIQEFLFAEVLRVVEEYQDSPGITLDRAHRARLLVALYNHCARELEPPTLLLVEKFGA
jgi:transcriptional regulator with XRE-family HTH domain